MLHTIKSPNKFFNLLFLEYSEFIINSTECIYYNIEKGCMEKGLLHLNTRSAIIIPEQIEQISKKYCFSDGFQMKIFSFEEVLQYFQSNSNEKDLKKGFLIQNQVSNQASTLGMTNKINKKSTLGSTQNAGILNNNDKKSSLPSIPVSIPSCSFFDFKLVNISEWMNKFVFDVDFKSTIDRNQKSMNHIINSKNQEQGRIKEDIDLSIKDIYSLLLKNSYRFSYLIGLLNGINDTYPLSSIVLSSLSNNSAQSQSQVQGYNNIDTPNTNNNNISNLKINKFLKEKEENPNSIKYFFLIIKASKTTKISRIPSIKYEISLENDIQLLILSLPLSKFSSFLEDRKLIEGLYSMPIDEKEYIDKIIKKKLSDTLESLSLSRESFDNQNIISNNNYKLVTKVKRILPEGNQIGVLVMRKSNQIQFFSSVNDYKVCNPVKQFMASEVNWIIIYRYLFKNKALHINLYNKSRGVIFDFDSISDMEYVKSVFERECFNIDKCYTDVSYHTQLWVNGQITNYDYLLYLNIISSRSFIETSQYPIFPWIITNYKDIDDFDLSEIDNYRNLAKPIGAINPDKLERLKKISIENELNYLYQNHYSTPFKLAYYLIRAFPHFSLRLNSGKHDKSDRIFYSLKDCWDSLISPSSNHVYELTPEFFNSEGEFLLNINDVSFDRTQEGKAIDNVILPKWAKNPKDLININRSALESEYVSCNLNDWIDLIFGHKQRGKEAENAENLFQPSSYDDFDYEKFPEFKKQNYLISIIELGQVPKRLFSEAHPQKKAVPSTKLMSSAPEYLINEIGVIRNDKERQERLLIELEKERESEKMKLEEKCKGLLEERIKENKQLKEGMEMKENTWKEEIYNLMDNNTKLKMAFDKYDKEKDDYYKNLIEKYEKEHRNNIDKKYNNKVELFKYVKSIEMSINKYKLLEKENEDIILKLNSQLKKYKRQEEDYKNEISKMRQRMNIK